MFQKIYLLSIILLITASTGQAQFAVGHTTITFNDPDRGGGFGSGGGPGRQIQAEVYYPASTSGEEVSLAAGSFPVIIFGHGFVMSWDAYENIWSYLVPEGYILVLPRTESGFSPSHEDFGLDLALVASRMQELNEATGNLFAGGINEATCIMGHSMGGGATMLAAANYPVHAIVGLAAAETNPSAIAAIALTEAPLLMFSGGSDGVTPPDEHQIPMYQASISDCKYHVTIIGGGHCYFANSNTNCDLGELFTGGNITISRAEQQTTMNDYLLPWLNYWLKSDSDAIQQFADLAFSDSRTTVSEQCIPTSISDSASSGLSVFPNPAHDFIRIDNNHQNNYSSASVFDASGKLVLVSDLRGSAQIDVRLLSPGIYHVVVLDGESKAQFRFVKE